MAAAKPLGPAPTIVAVGGTDHPAINANAENETNPRGDES